MLKTGPRAEICCLNHPSFGLVSFDPSGGVAYAASGSQLFQSPNNGQTFLPIHTFPQSITAISQIKGKPNLLWIGQSDGTMWWTNNALLGLAASWTKVVVNGAPSGQGVTGIAIDPKDSSTVVAVYPGFSGSADPPQHVFLTTDGGKKTQIWKNIGGTPGGGDNNLPDLPAFAVVILPTTKPHTIIVGSDHGVFQTADTGKTWQLLGTGFPPAQVTALALDYAVKPFVLRASTFGRSVFELQGSCPLCPPAAQCKMTGCIGDISWNYSLKCTGDGVGIVYNGGCRDTFGEPEKLLRRLQRVIDRPSLVGRCHWPPDVADTGSTGQSDGLHDQQYWRTDLQDFRLRKSARLSTSVWWCYIAAATLRPGRDLLHEIHSSQMRSLGGLHLHPQSSELEAAQLRAP